MSEIRLRYLLQCYFNEEATPEEIEELMMLLSNDHYEEEIKAVMNDVWKIYHPTAQIFSPEKSKSILNDILKSRAIQGSIRQKQKGNWYKVAAAILILVSVGSVAVYQGLLRKSSTSEIVGLMSQKPDIAPGGNKAILILEDGTKVLLDSASNGNLANQGNTKLTKMDGLIVYKSVGQSNEVLYNTISTPRGGQYQLLLADGTKVWLNAESTLRYPTVFVGNSRKVELKGEGYFEVKTDPQKPFKVMVADRAEVEVFGTHFNINSYSDEASINTTLLEGSVKITDNTTMKSYFLKPGQQAQIKPDGNIDVLSDINTGNVIGWKDEKFQFGEASDIAEVMRQIARWYDVEVVYRDDVFNEHIGGGISMNVNVSQVLNMLEMTGAVKFKIEGKKIIVGSSKK